MTSREQTAKALASQGFSQESIDRILSNYQEPRWLKPSEVTEPGAYWVAYKMYGGDYHITTVNVGFGVSELRGGGVALSAWHPDSRLLGPITPPEYTGDAP